MLYFSDFPCFSDLLAGAIKKKIDLDFFVVLFLYFEYKMETTLFRM